MHPGVAKTLEKARLANKVVGVVWSKDGSPRIEPDFIENLDPTQLAWVKDNLHQKGWRLDEHNKAVRS